MLFMFVLAIPELGNKGCLSSRFSQESIIACYTYVPWHEVQPLLAVQNACNYIKKKIN